MSEIGILNVGCGDTKLSFDKNNPQERIRAARIVKDMLRRGYALLVEIDQPNGTKTYQRVIEFKEDVCEYVIADFDPAEADKADQEEANAGGSQAEQTVDAASAEETGPATPPKRGRGSRKSIPAEGTRGVAIARSAGG